MNGRFATALTREAAYHLRNSGLRNTNKFLYVSARILEKPPFVTAPIHGFQGK
jgi:hypothetical protein